MVEDFDVIAITASSNARAMSAGISKATLPTMAGMVTSLSGIFFIAQIESKTRKAIANVEDELPLS
jgi:biopolymer transport protein ExbB